MYVDATTLTDLEVFRSVDGSEGLFDIVDRTQTEGGRRALRRRIEQPLLEPSDLNLTQDAVRFLMLQPHLIRIDNQRLKQVERYLQSNIELTTASFLGVYLESVWMATRYPDVLKELREGVDVTVSFFRHVAELGAAVGDHSPPSLISELAKGLQDGSEAVLGSHAERGSVLTKDRALRGRHRDSIRNALCDLSELGALHAMALAIGLVLLRAAGVPQLMARAARETRGSASPVPKDQA